MMSHWKSWLGLGILLVLLAGCSSAVTPSPTVTNPPAEPTVAAPSPTVAQAAATATTAPTATEEIAEVDQCVECHTDKDQLISTAKVEEEVEDESEGAG
jgi:mono/diheme cytochrome c family protein